jgi:putative transposase
MPAVSRSALPHELQRSFSAGRINERWAADLTYIRTGEGWLFLAVVLDLGSRRVVGWATGTRPDTELSVAALEMALTTRRPPHGLLHHSDRGVHYTSARYRRFVADHQIEPSYSRLGNCWDNAVVESFFKTLKSELRTEGSFATRKAAMLALFEFIEIWYNRKRRHSTLGHVSPADYERRLQ